MTSSCGRPQDATIRRGAADPATTIGSMSPLPRPSTTSELKSERSDRQVQQAVRSRELTRVRRGYYVTTSAWDSLSSVDQAVLVATTAAAKLGPAAVLSHTSAALLHGLPVGRLQVRRPHATWPSSAGRGATTSVIPHRGRLDAADVIRLDGVPVTTVARTLFDVARSAEAGVAVAMADTALRCGLVRAPDLEAMVAAHASRPGVRGARRILQFADEQSESVGESLTRVLLHELGLPRPELQAELTSSDGRFVARVDFLFRGLGTVLEFDGRVKYEKYLRAGESAADVVYREKLREDAIRALGFDIVRMVWSDLRDGRRVLERCTAAFERQGHTGWRPGVPGFAATRGSLR